MIKSYKKKLIDFMNRLSILRATILIALITAVVILLYFYPDHIFNFMLGGILGSVTTLFVIWQIEKFQRKMLIQKLLLKRDD